MTGDGESVGDPLVRHPSVDKVAFTGSGEVGRLVAQRAAEHNAETTLELGGKSAQIVFPDADLEAVTNGIVAGVFAACGQTCVAGSRLVVHESVHDEIVERVVARARTIRLGDPMDETTEMGPIAFPAHFERVREFVERGVAEGAVLATGGRRAPGFGDGLVFEPTVFTDARPGMAIVDEEIFGPVLSVLRFSDEDGGGPSRERLLVRARGRGLDERRPPRPSHRRSAAGRHGLDQQLSRRVGRGAVRRRRRQRLRTRGWARGPRRVPAPQVRLGGAQREDARPVQDRLTRYQAIKPRG